VVAQQESKSFVHRIPIAVLFCSVAFFWGMNSVTMKYAGRHGPPLTIAALRAIVGSLVLIVFARKNGADWPRGRTEWTGVALIGLFMTGISTACLLLAAKLIPAGLVSILSNTMPLFTAMLAPLLLKEKMTRRLLVGLLIGLVGTVIVGWRAIHGNVRPFGVGLGIAAGLFTSIGSVLYKKFPLVRIERRMLVGCQLGVSAIVLGVLSIPDDRSTFSFTPLLFVSFAYLSLIGLALSFVFYSELLSRATAMQSGSAAYLSTVMGVGLGALLLKEHLSWLVLIGGAITIAGVALVQLSQARAANRSG
jgi:drug/metabolite transporter (DMT)-like permease